MAEPLFRKKALESRNPNVDLDSLIQVTTPMGWLALGACLILLVIVTIWGIFSTLLEEV